MSALLQYRARAPAVPAAVAARFTACLVYALSAIPVFAALQYQRSTPPPPSPPSTQHLRRRLLERAAAAAAAAPWRWARDVDSGSDDAGKSSQRSAADLMV